MKKVVLLLSTTLLLFTGCSKDNSEAPISEQNQDVVFIFNDMGENSSWESFKLSEISNLNLNEVYGERGNNGNSAHCHGNFPGFVFSGTENNGGTHGSATASLGPWTISLETECIMADENQAVYGGTIVDLEGPPTPPNFPISLNNHMYFKVIDNGQGNNAPPDQFNGIIVFSPAQISRCGEYVPSHPLWSIIPDIDIEDPGSIKVNN